MAQAEMKNMSIYQCRLSYYLWLKFYNDQVDLLYVLLLTIMIVIVIVSIIIIIIISYYY